jgi:RND family efflux transporter MFP subunit
MKLTPIPIVVCAAIVLAACQKKKPQTASQPQSVDVAEVLIDSVTLHQDYPGYLTADDEVNLVARVNGYLTAKFYHSGQFVHRGDVLFTIESGQYANAVNQAKSQLANAKATFDYASNNYRAMNKALESDAVSQMEVLQAKSDVETSQASIKNAEAALRTAETTYGYCTVRAPFDGHVSASNYSVGTYLAGSTSPVTLATIYKDSIMTAHFSIDDNELASIIRNQHQPGLVTDMAHIPISFDVTLPHTYTANLNYMAPAFDRSTGTMQLHAKIKNPNNELHSGMYCKISLPSAILPHAVLVRDASIGTDQLGKYVYTVSDSNTVLYTPIEVGQLVSDTLRVVTKGLKPGDKYVTKALLKVRDGMKISPKLTK